MSPKPRKVILFCGLMSLICSPCYGEDQAKNPFDPCRIKDGHVNCFKFDYNLATKSIEFKEPIDKGDIPKVIEDLKKIQEKAN